MSSSEDDVPVSSSRNKDGDEIDDLLGKSRESEDDTSDDSEDKKEESESEMSESDGWGADFMGKGEEREKLLRLPEARREELIYERREERKRRQERKEAAARRRQSKARKQRPRRDHLTQQQEREAYALEQIKKRNELKKKKKIDEAYEEQDHEELPDEREEEEEHDEEVEEEDDYQEYGDEIEEEQVVSERKKWFSETPLNLKTVKACTIRRNELEKLIKKPYMKDYIQGMFVRVLVGNKEGRPIYRMAQISGITKSQNPYQLPNGEYTKYKLILSVGKAKMEYRITQMSTKSITSNEMDFWIKMLRKGDLKIPCVEELSYERAQREKYRRAFKITPQIMAQMVKEREEAGYVTNLTKQKAKLEYRIRELDPDDEEDKPEIEKLKARLERLLEQEEREKKDYNFSAHVEGDGATHHRYFSYDFVILI